MYALTVIRRIVDQNGKQVMLLDEMQRVVLQLILNSLHFEEDVVRFVAAPISRWMELNENLTDFSTFYLSIQRL